MENVRARNAAIWARVTVRFGQYFPVPQPLVMPRAASSSIHAANGADAGTSEKTPCAAGGWYDGPSWARRRNFAMGARVTGAAGQ